METSNLGNANAGDNKPETADKKVVATQEAVFWACEQLYLEAENITREKVSTMIGGGSPVVVMRFINEWREHRASENKRNKSEFEVVFASFGREVEALISKKQAEFEASLIEKIRSAGITGTLLPTPVATSGEEREDIVSPEEAILSGHEDSSQIQGVEDDVLAAAEAALEIAAPAGLTAGLEADPHASQSMASEPASIPTEDPAAEPRRPIPGMDGSAEFADQPDPGFIADATEELAPSPIEDDDFFPPVNDGDFELCPEDLLALASASKSPGEQDDFSLEDVEAALAAEHPNPVDAEPGIRPTAPARPQPADASRNEGRQDGWRSFETPML